MSAPLVPIATNIEANLITSKRKISSEINDIDSESKKSKIQSQCNILECNICVKKYDEKFRYICYNCGNMICLECKKKVSAYSGKTVRCPHCKSNNVTENSMSNHRKNIENIVRISREHKNYKYIYEELLKINQLIEYEVTQGSIDCIKFILEISEIFVCYEYYEIAFNWYNFIVNLTQDTKAIIKLGKMYEKGQYVEQNYKKAIELYKDVVKKGNLEGNFFLANLYETGKGVKKDLVEANKLYKLVAREYIISKLS